MNKTYLIIAAGIVVFSTTGLSGQTIATSKHNLSAGTIHTNEVNEICIFCHAAHNGEGQAPLWNRYELATNFTTYGSPTMSSETEQPGTKSRLCLSCHDGTIALGLVVSRDQEIPFYDDTEMIYEIPSDHRSNLSTDLTDDHPIALSQSKALKNSDFITSTGDSPLECTSCHNPHDNSYGYFLNTDPSQGALCISCHISGNWSNSSHATSTAEWNEISPDPWPESSLTTVNTNSCGNCHVAHGAASQYWLLQNNEEETCYNCHNGNVAATDVRTDILKQSAHTVSDYTSLHTPNEDPALMDIHVECTDCHNPHRARSNATTAPAVSGAMEGVPGITSSGTYIEASNYEYEICLKCHGNDYGGHYNNRMETMTLREKFDVTNLAHHAVFGIGTAPSPSLLEPWATTRMVKCTDCHGNDSGSNDAHGSIYFPILSRYLDNADEFYPAAYSSSNSALCYKCHDERIIRSSASFRLHNRHIRVSISCTTCHDPHGSNTYPHLLNFNTDIVSNISYVDDDPNSISGTCTMTCHGNVHINDNY